MPGWVEVTVAVVVVGSQIVAAVAQHKKKQAKLQLEASLKDAAGQAPSGAVQTRPAQAAKAATPPPAPRATSRRSLLEELARAAGKRQTEERPPQREESVVVPPRPPRRQAPPAPPPKVAPAATARRSRLDRKALRNAVVMREVLGKPKALEGL